VINDNVPLIGFLQMLGDKGTKEHYFLVAQFPNGDVVDIKYKFGASIIVPAEYNKYLGNFITDIINILDDGGFGTYLIIGEEN
jgi:hypothetical protein